MEKPRTDSQEAREGGGRQPSHRVYAIAEGRQGKKNFWTPIGAAWPHRDDKGFDLVLEYMPLAGQKIVLRTTVPREQGGAGENDDIPF